VAQRITIDDTIPPEIDWPGNIRVAQDPNQCGAYIVVPTPTVSDNCGVASIVNSHTETDDASGFYPIGVNNVMWTATDFCGNTSTSLQLVIVTANAPALSVSKAIEPPYDTLPASPGDSVTYTIVVTNTGDTDIYDLAVSDSQLDALTGPVGDAGQPGVLERGESWTYTGNWTPSEASDCLVTNRATATGHDVCGASAIGVGVATVETTNQCTSDGGGGGGGLENQIIISEVAWAGTRANPEHEWIELANPGAGSVDLDGWTLAWRERRAPDQTIDVITTLGEFRQLAGSAEHWEVELSGNLRPDDYYLLERYSDDVVEDLNADLVYGDLLTYDAAAYRLCDTPGEELYLFDPQGSLVSTANTDYGRTEAGAARYHDGTPWPGGCCELFASMERVNASRLESVGSLDLDDEWDTNRGILINGLDASLHPLTATAQAANEDSITISGSAMQLGTLTALRGEPVMFTIQLLGEAALSVRLPRVTLLAGDPEGGAVISSTDPTGGEGEFAAGEWTIAGAGGEWSLSGQAATVDITRSNMGGDASPWANVAVRTGDLAPGEYTLCITQGDEVVYIIALTILAE